MLFIIKNKNNFLDKINFYLKNEKAREDIVKKIDNKIILKIDQKNFDKYFFQLIKKIKPLLNTNIKIF